MVRPRPEQFGGVSGRIKAKQVTNVAAYPTITLHPCQFSEGVGWFNPPPLLLCAGIAFSMSGSTSFAPVIVPPIDVDKFHVWIQIDAFSEEARFLPRLMYYDNNENPHQQVARAPISGETDKFVFVIPSNHINSTGWFTCVLFVDLLTPLEGDAKKVKEEKGQENPYHPMILRGAWVEIQGK